jgi:deoxycytidylate deaminase
MSTTLHRQERSILEQFLADPRTANLRETHATSIHAAVIVKRGKVIAHATNKIGSRSRGSGYSAYTIHAERNAVKQLGDISQLRGADMYIMRFSKDRTKTGFDRFMGSKPCPSCQLFLEKCMREYGLKNVFYTSDDA